MKTLLEGNRDDEGMRMCFVQKMQGKKNKNKKKGKQTTVLTREITVFGVVKKNPFEKRRE